MPPIAAIAALLTKKGTWITIFVTLGVFLAGFAVMNYVAVKSENMVLSTKIEKVEDQLDQVRANAQANAKAIRTRNELIEALTKVEETERAETMQALKANPDWAAQPIPADILASLRD